MPDVAPVAVEPREIKPPTTPEVKPSTLEELEAAALAEADEQNGEGNTTAAAEDKKKSFPLIPIVAAVVALVVIGLLGKVLMQK